VPESDLLGVAAGVEDGQDNDPFLFGEKVNYERKASDHCAANFASDFRKHFRIVCDALKVFLYRSSKFAS
jgi:hypothetical protein